MRRARRQRRRSTHGRWLRRSGQEPRRLERAKSARNSPRLRRRLDARCAAELTRTIAASAAVAGDVLRGCPVPDGWWTRPATRPANDQRDSRRPHSIGSPARSRDQQTASDNTGERPFTPFHAVSRSRHARRAQPVAPFPKGRMNGRARPTFLSGVRPSCGLPAALIATVAAPTPHRRRANAALMPRRCPTETSHPGAPFRSRGKLPSYRVTKLPTTGYR